MNFNKILIGLLAIMSIMILSACGEDESGKYTPDPQLETEVENFEYTNQDGETVSLEDLKGNYWLATFIFTNCETVCPPMTANMAKVQSEAKEEDIDLRFVSFTVDPANDDPEDLKEYGNKFGADFSNWDFLTGFDQKEIESFAANSFKTLVAKVDGYDQVNHGISFFLVSPEGTVLNMFSGTDQEEFSQITDYVKYYKKD
ncbi:SCO family protein [Allobacillus sp. GCM10007491]|uniref:SCO family protein n=1 Tax=Allobacillus saliphilus TaxID=2912308 RepID=A0A941CT95_9BACI|nr:SCO family protein [Allobacillus saliphilus]MBR7553513.1 SCO family protein [Allobacillus saliphilus]